MEWLKIFRWQDIVEILLFAFIIYRFFLFIRGRRTQSVFYGLLFILFFGVLAQLFHFYTISWVFKNLFAIWIIALLIVFQPELRSGLARIGKNPFLLTPPDTEVIDETVKAVNYLSRNRMGAIIAFEREMGLREYMEGGVKLDAQLSSELLATIFTPYTPLHDGAVIIQGDRVMAANCILPLPEETGIMRGMGARHRAAFNLARETDAVVVIVSEETGRISLAYQGRIESGLDGVTLRERLREIFGAPKKFRLWKTKKK
ncbi:MAG TPA: TIGR00159 family protein [bacterium]|nr:TIGR00159 family protein [bacterium]HEX68466.1 TIGR00159 family protein [bacterium]